MTNLFEQFRFFIIRFIEKLQYMFSIRFFFSLSIYLYISSLLFSSHLVESGIKTKEIAMQFSNHCLNNSKAVLNLMQVQDRVRIDGDETVCYWNWQTDRKTQTSLYHWDIHIDVQFIMNSVAKLGGLKQKQQMAHVCRQFCCFFFLRFYLIIKQFGESVYVLPKCE